MTDFHRIGREDTEDYDDQPPTAPPACADGVDELAVIVLGVVGFLAVYWLASVLGGPLE